MTSVFPKPSSGGIAVWAAAFAIVAGGLAAYANSFAGPFVFLDVPAIVDNPTIRHLWPIDRVLTPPADGGLTVGGRPVANLSLAVNYALGGTHVWGYHALNLAIHILAGLALFGIARRTLERIGAGGPPGIGPLPPAFAIALLWTVHPLQTESVTYIVQRAESLMGLFYLLTLYCFIRGAEVEPGVSAGEKEPGHRPSLWFGLSWLACLLGMATKEVMVSAPVIVFLYDRAFVSGTFREAWRRRRGFHLGLACTWILLGILVAGTGSRGGTAGFGLGFPWWKYVLTQFGAIVHYLRLAAWPHPLDLDCTARWVSRPINAAPAALLVALLAAGSAFAFFRPGAAGRGGARAFGFAGAWFFAILAPTSLVPGVTQTIAEHRMYLALAPVLAAGVCAAAAAVQLAVGRAGGAAGASARGPGSTPALHASWFLAGTLALAVVFGVLTARRNRDYRSDLALWTDTVEKSPDNPFAFNNLGIALVDAGRLPEAAARFGEALRLKPDYAEALNNLGLAVAGLGRVPEAITHYREALRIRPDYPEAHANLGVALVRSGRNGEAMEQFKEALRLRPGYADARNNLAVALAGAGRLDEAINQYEEVLRTRPDSAETQYNLGNALAAKGRLAEAIAHYGEAVRLNPAHVEAQANLGAVLAESGRNEEAIAHYQRALQLDPNDADVHYNLGLAMRATGRSAESEAEFRAAARLRGGM